MEEWIKSTKDNTEARATEQGIEVRLQGRMDSTVYRVKDSNRADLTAKYPELFIKSWATGEAPAETALSEVVQQKPAKMRRGKK